MPFPAGQRACLKHRFCRGSQYHTAAGRQSFRLASRDLLIIMNRLREWRYRESHFVVSARVAARHDPNSRVRERTSVLYSRKVGPHE